MKATKRSYPQTAPKVRNCFYVLSPKFNMSRGDSSCYIDAFYTKNRSKLQIQRFQADPDQSLKIDETPPPQTTENGIYGSCKHPMISPMYYRRAISNF